jgi:hypothetical protein
VLSTIYPIKQVHIDLLKGQLKRAGDGLDEKGNYRITMPIDK